MANVFQPVTQSLFGPIGSYNVREALRDAANREFFANLRAGRASPVASPLVPTAPIPENVQRFTRKKRPDDYWTDSDLIVDPPITETDPVTQDTFNKGGFEGWGESGDNITDDGVISRVETTLKDIKDADEGMGLTYSGGAGPFTDLQLSRSGFGFGSGGYQDRSASTIPVINVAQLPNPKALTKYSYFPIGFSQSDYEKDFPPVDSEVDKKETENVQPPPPVNQRGFFSTLGGMLPSMGDIGGALSRFGKTTPVGTAFTLSQDPDVPLGAKIAAGATAIAPTILGGMATPVSMLGSILNSMGWYTNPNEVTSNVTLGRGNLGWDSDVHPGGGGYQTGTSNIVNMLNDPGMAGKNVDTWFGDIEANELGNMLSNVDESVQSDIIGGVSSYTGEDIGTDTSSGDAESDDWDWDF